MKRTPLASNMPTSSIGDSRSSIPSRSHDDDSRHLLSHSRDTRPESHRSSSKGPRDDNDERRARTSTTSNEESGSRSRTDKGLPSDSHPPANVNDPKDAGRSGEPNRPISISSDDSYDMVEDKKPTSSSKRLDHHPRSSTRDSTSGSRHTAVTSERERSYSQVAITQAVAGIKSSGNNAPRPSPSLNPETRPTHSDSPTKHTASHPPRAPTDTRSASSTGQNSYPPSAPSRSQPQLTDPDDSSAQTITNPQSDANFALAEVPPPTLPGMFPPGLDPAQQSSSSQQPQLFVQPGESREHQGVTGFFRSAASVLSGSTGTPPRDKAKEERFQFENLQADYKRTTREHRILKQRCGEVEHENSRLKDNNRALQHELISIQRELDEAKSLSEIRGKELMGAQVFLTKADSLSMSDVIDKVGILNEEIFQTAALFAEGIHHKKLDIPQETLEKLYDQSRLAIGDLFTQLLHTQAQVNEANPEVNPLLAQAVVSSFMVHFCISKLNSWYPSDPNISEFLTTVYSQMRQTEEQAVFGRWRSLIRAQIRPSTDGWNKELTSKLEIILNIASWDAPYELKKAFYLKLIPIFKALEDVRIALYEKFTSSDLQAFSVDPAGRFESWMEDAYGDGRQAQSSREEFEIVAGTTGIGLKRFKVNAHGTRGGSGEIFENVISPKVVLVSTLKEALNPPPPTKAKSKKRPVPEEGGGRH